MQRTRTSLAILFLLLGLPLAAQVGPVRFLYIPGGALALHSGDTQQLTAQEFYFSNSTQTTAVIDVTNQVQWSVATTFSSCPPGPAGPPPAAGVQATVSSSGLVTVTGSGSGNLAVLAKSGPILACKQLTITGIQSIAVTPASSSVAQGDPQQMFATATFTDASTNDITILATWNSDDTADVPISATGVVNVANAAVISNAANITATYGTVTSPAAVVTVVKAVLESITVAPAKTNMTAATLQFTATGNFSNGTPSNLTSLVTWASSNTNVVTMSNGCPSFPCFPAPPPKGTATAKSAGVANITATSGSIVGGTTLNVGMTSISVTPVNISIAKGTSQLYTATGHFGVPTANVTGSVNWTSTNTSVATVGLRIRCTFFPYVCTGTLSALGVGQGSSTIRAASGALTGSTGITVTPPVLNSVTVTPADISTALGLPVAYTATGFYNDGSTQNLTNTAGITFSSNMTGVADFPGGGSVASTLLAGGPATITATCDNTCSAGAGAIAGATTLTVMPALLAGISITPKNQTVARKGTGGNLEQRQFTATGTWTDNTPNTLPFGGDQNHVAAPVAWDSQDRAVATINAGGLASSQLVSDTGLTEISATSGSVRGRTNLNVGVIVTSIVVAPVISATMPVGGKQSFTATGHFSNGLTEDLTTTVTWSACNNAAISNTSGSEGLLTASAVNANCSVTATDPTSTTQGAFNLAIRAVTNIAPAPANQTISVGNQLQYTATADYTGGMMGQNISPFVTWSSQNSAVASIDPASGMATADAAGGPINIFATVGAASGNTPLTVNTASLVSVTVTPANPSIATNTSQQFTATANFSDGSTQDVTNDPGTVWASSNTAVATISDPDNPGLASSLKGPGTTIISATFTPAVGPVVMGQTLLTTHF